MGKGSERPPRFVRLAYEPKGARTTLAFVEVSEDGMSWSNAWEGETALITYVAALEMPRTVPLRIPLGNRRAQYVRMRQTGADRTYYWTIAELKVFGS